MGKRKTSVLGLVFLSMILCSCSAPIYERKGGEQDEDIVQSVMKVNTNYYVTGDFSSWEDILMQESFDGTYYAIIDVEETSSFYVHCLVTKDWVGGRQDKVSDTVYKNGSDTNLIIEKGRYRVSINLDSDVSNQVTYEIVTDSDYTEQDLFIRGTMNRWQTKEIYRLRISPENNNIHTITVDIKQGKEFKIGNYNWSWSSVTLTNKTEELSISITGNLVCNVSGTYSLSVNYLTHEITYSVTPKEVLENLEQRTEWEVTDYYSMEGYVYLDVGDQWWSDATVYVFGLGSETAPYNAKAWPGASMEYDATIGYYKFNLGVDVSACTIIFSTEGGAIQTPNLTYQNSSPLFSLDNTFEEQENGASYPTGVWSDINHKYVEYELISSQTYYYIKLEEQGWMDSELKKNEDGTYYYDFEIKNDSSKFVVHKFTIYEWSNGNSTTDDYYYKNGQQNDFSASKGKYHLVLDPEDDTLSNVSWTRTDIITSWPSSSYTKQDGYIYLDLGEQSWSDIYCYVWGSEDDTLLDSELTTYPGKQMELDSSSSYYKIYVGTDVDYCNVVFSTNDGKIKSSNLIFTSQLPLFSFDNSISDDGSKTYQCLSGVWSDINHKQPGDEDIVISKTITSYYIKGSFSSWMDYNLKEQSDGTFKASITVTGASSEFVIHGVSNNIMSNGTVEEVSDIYYKNGLSTNFNVESGIYDIILDTSKDEDKQVSWVRTGDATLEYEDTVYLRGTINSWGCSDEYLLTPSSSKSNTYEIIIDLDSGACFKFANSDWSFSATTLEEESSDLFINGDGNIQVINAGTYYFEVDTSTNKIGYAYEAFTKTAVKEVVEYEVKGSFDWNNNVSMSDPENDGIFSCNVTFNSENGEYLIVKNTYTLYDDGSKSSIVPTYYKYGSGNYQVSEAGEYIIVFDTSTGMADSVKA